MSALRYLGVVPARAGSKAIPRKNLVDLGGKPLLQWTLEAAQASRRLDGTLLTSDDDEALELAARLGCASVRRPAELAGDATPMADVVLHALEQADAETVVLLQPTSPFRDGADVDAAIAEFEASGRDTLVAVVPVSQHPAECLTRVDGELVFACAWPEGATGRQGLPPFWYVNGAVYVVRTAYLRERRAFQDSRSALYVMEPSHSVDIDDPFDLEVARGLVALGRR